jgi:hypothetical protein
MCDKTYLMQETSRVIFENEQGYQIFVLKVIKVPFMRSMLPLQLIHRR